MYLSMRADITLEMMDGETREDAEDRIIYLIETLRNQGLYLIGWTGETEVVEDDD